MRFDGPICGLALAALALAAFAPISQSRSGRVDQVEESGMSEQTVRKTYQDTLKPTPEQERELGRELGRVLGLCRSLSNTALEQRITAWQRARVSVSRVAHEAELTDIRAAMPEYAAIHSHVVQDVLSRLDKTAQAFYRRVQAGEKAGFPRYRARTRAHAFTDQECGHGASLDDGVVVLSKIGRVAVRWSRLLAGVPTTGTISTGTISTGTISTGTISTGTISTEADGWSVRCSCADAPTHRLPPTGQETGLDLGIEAFATLATLATLAEGRRIVHPGGYRTAERALKTAQRRVSRRKTGSARRRTAVTLLAKAYQVVRRQRQDVHHKTALALLRATDVLSPEDLQTANLVRNHHLAKSMQDAGWAAFLSILTYKAACAGRSVVAVPPASTSQTCSGCGVVVVKGVSVRWHSCPACGTSLHRDHNAAKKSERLGQSRRGGVALAASEN
jgi:putative transposase